MASLKDTPNIAYNAVLPFNPMRGRLAAGTAEYIAVEVLVSKFLRKLMKFADKGFFELAYIHAVSMPFLGGAAGFMEANSSYADTYMRNLKDGAKGVPAVLIAQWVYETCFKGFHVPSFNLKDVMITAAAKSLSKPLVKMVYKNLPEDMASALNVVGEMVKRQNAASFNYAKK